MKRPCFQFAAHRIDVQKNEKEVIEFLHSLKIYEHGHISNPAKEVWFPKLIHHIQIIDVWTAKGSWFGYTYVSKTKKYQGEELKDLTFLQLRHIFA